jgi:hypothetical protein
VSHLRRLAPGLLLLVLAPLVAEFLLGDFSIKQIALLLVFIPQYGGGALLVREVTRRSRRGWPTMLLLALAYALIEEGFTTETLFNPNYANQRLLDYGLVPALGISVNWTIFVLMLHVVWSIGSPIAIAEALAGARATVPWLGRVGLAVTALVYLMGCGLTAVITAKMFPYVASPAQLGVTAGLVCLVIAAASAVTRAGERPRTSAAAPATWLVSLVTFGLSGAFQAAYHVGGQRRLSAPAIAAIMLALVVVAHGLLARWSRRSEWTPAHALAAGAGAILTYATMSLGRMIAGQTALGVPTDAIDITGQFALASGMLTLVMLGFRRQRAARCAGRP